MARIRVKALVTGTHAMSGLYIETGGEYEIEEEHFGNEVFEKIITEQKRESEEQSGSQPAAQRSRLSKKED
jgi:hypothetical protein